MKALVLAIAPLLAGCWVSIKTPLVAQYERLDNMQLLDADQDAIELALGTPQGAGIHRIGDRDLTATFYQGMIGKMSLGGSIKADYGMAFISYADSHVDQLLYARSSQFDPAISMRGALPITELADKLTLGASKIDDATKVLGLSAFRGKRVNKTANIQNDILWYDRSEPPSSYDPIKERLLLLGYDQEKTLRDLMWISSFPEDVKGLGDIKEQRFSEFSKLDLGSWTGWQSTGGATAAIDPVQVDALLRTRPKRLDELIKVLGEPTGRGIKAFQESQPLLVASWSSFKAEVLGRESIVVPDPSIPSGQRSISYAVLNMPQSRLIVAHEPDGEIVEIMWFAPRAAP